MAKRNILVLAQHAPQARRLGVLLGDQYDVTGWDSLPESGEINADVVLATRLTAQEAVRLRCALLQIPGAGLDGIPLGALRPAAESQTSLATRFQWPNMLSGRCLITASQPSLSHTIWRPGGKARGSPVIRTTRSFASTALDRIGSTRIARLEKCMDRNVRSWHRNIPSSTRRRESNRRMEDLTIGREIF
jgi:hypothetical protein